MSKEDRVLTGITTTGVPHLGNLVGAVLPAIKASEQKNTLSFLFLADYHSLIKNSDSNLRHQSSFDIAACWLACGLDPKKIIFYRQSDIPHIFELAWILSCLASKGLLNRAHAYKSATSDNEAKKTQDIDKGINMGLFNYPVLMAADILMFKADYVQVGQDQKQHIEMTRDIALKFNHRYGDILTPPEAIIDQNTGILPGIDGRKMSKSYEVLDSLARNSRTPIHILDKLLSKEMYRSSVLTNESLPRDLILSFLASKKGRTKDERTNYRDCCNRLAENSALSERGAGLR